MFKARKGITFQSESVFWPQSTFCKLNEFPHKYDINHLVGLLLCGIPCCVHLCLTQKSPSHYHHLHSTLSQSVLQIIQEEKSFELSIFQIVIFLLNPSGMEHQKLFLLDINLRMMTVPGFSADSLSSCSPDVACLCTSGRPSPPSPASAQPRQ